MRCLPLGEAYAITGMVTAWVSGGNIARGMVLGAISGAIGGAVNYALQSGVQEVMQSSQPSGGTRGDALEEVIIVDEWEKPDVPRGRTKEISRAELRKIEENSLYEEIDVDPAVRDEITSVVNDKKFRDHANVVFQDSLKARRELGTLSVYQRDGNYYVYNGGRPDPEISNRVWLEAPDPNKGRHVFDWHPHIRGNKKPSPADIETSYKRGVPGVIWYGEDKFRIYQGGCKAEALSC
ncbi:MAG: hypothetical protein KatS3mg121_0872 [Gammaproteobacteria bacterium]|nr:MAG: hypothetical protein KatS3mg121_0872 [Gammaproteobacteria bacterium]